MFQYRVLGDVPSFLAFIYDKSGSHLAAPGTINHPGINPLSTNHSQRESTDNPIETPPNNCSTNPGLLYANKIQPQANNITVIKNGIILFLASVLSEMLRLAIRFQYMGMILLAGKPWVFHCLLS